MGAGSSVVGMDEAADRALVVELELHLDRRPLSGCLRGREGAEQAFVGWLGFLEALQLLADHEGRPR